DRRMLSATGFLQGTVFVDNFGNGHLEAVDTRVPGASVQLFQQQPDTTYSPVGSAVTTGADGTYLFTGLSAGTYRIVETPPAGYSNVGTELTSDLGTSLYPLDTPSQVSPTNNTIQVTLADPAQLQVNLDGTAYFNGGVPNRWEGTIFSFNGVQ